MASHELFGGRVQPRTMLSLDPWTVSPRGYPLLLQTGEAYHGEPLHDRQHPHDFWMELGATYERAVTKQFGLSVYVAPSGEPALGPVAFMHRPSAMDNPAAPLGHHWQDATHVSFGVLTAGIFTNRWKVEGSVFNGREPDENRWDFDPIKLDSYAGRVTFNPDSAWSFTTGYGYLESPEALEPTASVHRLTASAMHGTKLGANGQWSTALVYGMNRAHGGLTHSALVESEAVLDQKNTVFARAELVEKNAEDLVVDRPPFGIASDRQFTVAAMTLGGIREVVGARGGRATIGIGASGTLNIIPSALRDAYGSRTPLGGMLFVRVRPAYKHDIGMSGPHMDHHMMGAAESPGARR
jgi:hypothetical protein